MHVGIHGGSVYHQAHRQDTDGFLTDNAGWTTNKWGGHAGGGIGYNWTTCSTVWGVELDGSWIFGTKNFLPDNPNGGSAPGDGINTRVDALFTARVRSGVALDNLLLYVTGGFAAARFRTSWVATPTTVAEFRDWRWGWTAGVGTEWAWTPNVSLKFETLYVGFTDRDHDFTVGGGYVQVRAQRLGVGLPHRPELPLGCAGRRALLIEALAFLNCGSPGHWPGLFVSRLAFPRQCC